MLLLSLLDVIVFLNDYWLDWIQLALSWSIMSNIFVVSFGTPIFEIYCENFWHEIKNSQSCACFRCSIKIVSHKH